MAKPGDRVKVETREKTIEGILVPSPEAEEDVVFVKLDSGYNVGVDKKNIKSISVIELYREGKKAIPKAEQKRGLPRITILHTGGTIASKVDYRTGAVVSRFSPAELLGMFPELKEIANIDSRLVFQMFSEDMEPAHWSILAAEIKKEIDKGAEGIIVTHGTDTMHYTSAALSFMLDDSGIPVILVGAQRSSDRGSTDALVNLVCAAKFITRTDFAGVAVCMHESMNDEACLIHSGAKVRKMHSSRRDAFRSINAAPIAKVWPDGKFEFVVKDYKRKDKNKKTILMEKFEGKVGLVKIHPGFEPKILDAYSGYKGIVIEGTGLGNAPTNVLDDYTRHHKEFLDNIRGLVKKGVIVVMTTQTIYGRVNMNVYSTGRDLLSAGVIPAEDMTPETAFVKLGWLLGNYDKEEAKTLIVKNLRGEISERSGKETFLI